MPLHKNQADYDPRSKPSIFRSQVNSDPYTKVKSISIPTVK